MRSPSSRASYARPASHETHSVTTRLIAPTVMTFGDDGQRAAVRRALPQRRELCCQLFSEPGAGSDLGGLACRAVRDGDEWVVNGQKVWSSGARFSEWGELIARTDPDVVKHKGLTAFIIPMDLAGHRGPPDPPDERRSVVQRGVLQRCACSATRCASASVGEGWRVALTTLGFERDRSSEAQTGRVGGSWAQLLATARAMGVTDDPVDPAVAGNGVHARAHRELRSTGGWPISSPPARRLDRKARSASCSGRTG